MKRDLIIIASVITWLLAVSIGLGDLIPVEDAVNMAFVGGIIRGFGAKKQEKKLKKRRMSFSDRLSELKSNRPKLSHDNSGYKGVVDDIELERQVNSGARLAGEEFAKDSIRKSSSNAVNLAKKTANSGSNLQNLAAKVQANENDALGKLEANIGAQRESNDRFIAGRSDAAKRALNEFDADAFLNEFEFNEAQPYERAFADERQLEQQILDAGAAKREAFASSADAAVNIAVQAATAGIGVPGGFGGVMSGKKSRKSFQDAVRTGGSTSNSPGLYDPTTGKFFEG